MAFDKGSHALRPSHVVVIGAGPSGLTAAHSLLKEGIDVTILEKRDVLGGQGGTNRFEGRHGTYRFDYGGHRFITSNTDLLALVEEVVGDDLLTAERHSVIRLAGRIYDYPLSARNLLRVAPKSTLAAASFDLLQTIVQSDEPPPDADFATWTRARFGETLYRTFFEGYTRKLWGIEPDALSGDWAAQRISLLHLRDVARRLLPGTHNAVRTYASSYRYPRHGFGMIFDRLAERVMSLGGQIRTGISVTGFETQTGRISSVQTTNGPVLCDAVISTVPLPDMVRLTGGTSDLKFRGLRFFNFTADVENVSPYTWQYLSDPHILATRLQEPKRRSPEMAPPGKSSLMLEIPCNPGDAIWEMSDAQLIPRIRQDIQHLNLDPSLVTDEHFSVRTATAYPLMVHGYEKPRQKAFDRLSQLPNLLQCGRQGTFRYVFTDTAMEMGILAAQSLVSGEDLRKQVFEHRNERVVIETQSVA